MTIRPTHYTTGEALELIERSRPDTRADWFLLEALRDGLSYWIVNPTSGQRLDGPSQHWYGDDREELCNALRRGYTTVNAKTAVQDGQVDLDDLLTNRPGGVLGEIRIDRLEFDQFLSDRSSVEPVSTLTAGQRRRGGQQRRYDTALQDAINLIRDDLLRHGKDVNPPTVWAWLCETLANRDREYTFEPPIPDFDDPYIDGEKLVWKGSDGRDRDIARKSLDRYVTRAKAQN